MHLNPAALVMGPLLAQGRVFVNSRLPFGDYKGASDRALRVVVFHWRTASSTAGEMAFTFAHEYAHWFTSTRQERVADAVACALFNPSYGGCR